jgi:hypothetical protein
MITTPRGCNEPAHELAALGLGVTHQNYIVWISSYPNSVTRLTIFSCPNRIQVFHVKKEIHPSIK